MHDAGPDALAARFRAEAERLAGGPIRRLGVAVSGGPDSLAMLLLAHAAFPGGVAAATVDHGLRRESAAEAEWVGRICTGLGIDHQVLRGEAPSSGRGGVQATARAQRYALLAYWAEHRQCSHVATAHHADDQAETILMRLGRGAGLPGLAGIRPVRRLNENHDAMLIRPLLGWRRAELAGIVAATGLSAVDDPSNRSPRFDRTRIRSWLAAAEAVDAPRIAAAAAHLEDCEEALAWAADAAWRLRALVGETIEIDVEGLPREIRRRLAKRAIETIRHAAGMDGPWREDGLDRMLAALERQRSATLAGILCADWRFSLAPPRR
ncbi:MAG: tRNA lysidine(34) synthetase TilS [Sphingomonas sp.]